MLDMQENNGNGKMRASSLLHPFASLVLLSSKYIDLLTKASLQTIF
jgi:hypothetical protein